MERSKSFEDRWFRILACTGTSTDSALARVLGILPQSVTAARKRGQIPTGWIEHIAEQLDISTDWLFFGRGPMHPSDTPIGHQEAGIRPETMGSETCARCAKLEAKLEKMEEERRELAVENRKLWKENGELREKCARLEERMDKPLVSRGTAEMGKLG
ncbi:helix-turn-helix domain-containing protein [Bilophila wadsworthia]|uniref:helix-turn-helix domain-containing protein n=1 Tax=Bilophila wadsworthia TaxID=35833 RepID=UPI001D0A43DB|nr:helix-turn-helix domain-containing protein [Bilophila wadsworthia]MCB8571314.1 helix-turn-helix domain-containing protein [Bilophila wadsworthia]MCC2714662.1 helix-turn-helix domain-containing protein [Bilophila wadsworthia]